jgi:hypothetical protein
VASDAAPGRGLALVWAIFAVVAGAMALLAALEWGEALATGRPILYGEGSVAHAAILLRDGTAYRDTTGAVAANYPPLYLLVASLGDPFRAGRAATIASAVAVAVIVAWRARNGGRLVAAALGLGWIGLAPVAIWGAAIKPDVFAIALTLGGVAVLDRSRGARAAFFAGVLLELALWSKPTAALPAIALLAWVLLRERGRVVSLLGGFIAAAAVMLAYAVALGPLDVWRHVVAWNVLPWSAEQTVLVVVLGVATLGVVLAVAVMARGFRGLTLAYLTGALAVVALSGREGATINYLLDLAAAISYALATVAPRLRASAALPIAGTVQLALAVALLTPFGIVPGRAPTTGAWGQPERGAVVHALGPGRHLVEDSGLLVADGREPPIDDLFLWSRLARTGAIDPAPVIAMARGGAFASIVSEADLAALDRAPAYERARWDPALVAAILDRYVLDRSTGVLWVYRPR